MNSSPADFSPAEEAAIELRTRARIQKLIRLAQKSGDSKKKAAPKKAAPKKAAPKKAAPKKAAPKMAAPKKVAPKKAAPKKAAPKKAAPKKAAPKKAAPKKAAPKKAAPKKAVPKKAAPAKKAPPAKTPTVPAPPVQTTPTIPVPRGQTTPAPTPEQQQQENKAFCAQNPSDPSCSKGPAPTQQEVNEQLCIQNPGDPSCSKGGEPPPQTVPSPEDLAKQFCSKNPNLPKCSGGQEPPPPQEQGPPPASDKICSANPKYPGCDALSSQPDLGRPTGDDVKIPGFCESNPQLPQCQQEKTPPPQTGPPGNTGDQGPPDFPPPPGGGAPIPPNPPSPPPPSGESEPPPTQIQAVTECPAGTGVLYDGTCGTCPIGTGIRTDGTCGACPTGYDDYSGVGTDGYCLEACPAGTVREGDQCVAGCPAGQTLFAGQCVVPGNCPEGQVSIESSNGFECIDRDECLEDDFMVDREGACIGWSICRDSGGVILDQVCLDQCPEGQEQVGINCQAAVAACPAGTRRYGDQCYDICAEGEVQWGTQCVAAGQCPQGQVSYEGQCVEYCPEGWLYRSNVCVQEDACTQQGGEEYLSYCVASCAEGEMRLGSNSCVAECPEGREPFLGHCALASTSCSDGEVQVDTSDGSECVNSCPWGTFERLGRCVPGRLCTAQGGVVQDDQCLVQCPGSLTSIDGNCNCTGGQVESGDQCVAQCPAGQVIFGNTCRDECPEASSVAEGTNQCVIDPLCPAGQSYEFGQCYEEEPGYDESISDCEEMASEMDPGSYPEPYTGMSSQEVCAAYIEDNCNAAGSNAGSSIACRERPCGDGLENANGQCVAPCASGQERNESGQCVASSPPDSGTPPPAEGEQPPAEEEQPPAENQQPPAEGEQPPDGTQPPAEGEQPPDGTQPPAEGEQPPDGTQPPAEGEQPPDTGTPPPDGQQPPAEDQQPPAEGEQPPPDTGTPPPDTGTPPPPDAGTPLPPPGTGKPPKAPAPDKAKKRPPVDTITGYTKRTVAQVPLGIVIANARYKSKVIKNSRHAVGGAAEFTKFLQTDMRLPANRILSRRDMRRGDFLALFGQKGGPAGRLKKILARAPASEVIIYYSGRAMPVEGGRDAVLLPRDAKFKQPARTGYRLSELYRRLASLGVKRLRLYLDTAFSTPSNAQPTANAPAARRVQIAPAFGPFGKFISAKWVVISATTMTQPAYADPKRPRSSFTDALLGGLRGYADTIGEGNKDGAVTAGELEAFLRKELHAVVQKATGGTQRPGLFGSKSEILTVGLTPKHKSALPTPQQSSTVKPSFNCAKAFARAEKAICASPAIATLDNVMVGLYKKARAARRGAARNALVAQQKKWLKQRNSCGSDIACLAQRYGERIGQLQ